MPLFSDKAPGFDSPIALPADAEQSAGWQAANRAWWESQPMRYDWEDGITAPEYSREYFQEIDRRFFAATRPFMPWRETPFDELINFQALGNQDVLEIGVGCGTHAQLLASRAKSFTGIDLTQFAVNCTTRRLQAFGLRGNIRRMDAELMDFADGSFDFVWSWGVIHHSANTRQILQQMHRVLRPGGTAITMVYHRNFWNYYLVSGFFRGVLGREFMRSRSLNDILQKQTDGALARHYTEAEWAALVGDRFGVDYSRIYGMKVELLPLRRGRIKAALEAALPDSLGRTLTNKAKMGTFLVTKLTRRN